MLIDKLTFHTALPAHDIVPPASIGFANNPVYPYDRAAARALLEKGGWRAGADGIRANGGARLDLVMVVDPSGQGPAYGVQLQQMLRAVGIGLTIKPYPYKGIFAFDGPIVNGRFDLAVFGNTLPYDPDSTSTLTCANFAPKGENESRTCDPVIDALERAGLATDDPQKPRRSTARSGGGCTTRCRSSRCSAGGGYRCSTTTCAATIPRRSRRRGGTRTMVDLTPECERAVLSGDAAGGRRIHVL